MLANESPNDLQWLQLQHQTILEKMKEGRIAPVRNMFTIKFPVVGRELDGKIYVYFQLFICTCHDYPEHTGRVDFNFTAKQFARTRCLFNLSNSYYIAPVATHAFWHTKG